MVRVFTVLLWIILVNNSFAHDKEQILYLYNWSEYIPDRVIEKFTEETGIKVEYSTFDSNEAMYSKIKLLAGQKGVYDLVIPSSYYVSKMIKADLLEKIDISKIKNIAHINAKFLNLDFDQHNLYSFPYMWGSTGIVYNSEVVTEEINSWSILFDEKYKGEVLLNNDIREVFGLAFKMLGYSINDKNDAHIEEAFQLLRKLFQQVKIFNSESPKINFLNDEAKIGMTWNGEAYMASLENPKIKFAYPKEGTILWIDSFVIPKGARNIDNAHKFIDFIHKPEISKIIVEEIGYSTPNKTAIKLLPRHLQENIVICPTEKIIDSAELLNDLGDKSLLYDKYWTILKAELY